MGAGVQVFRVSLGYIKVEAIVNYETLSQPKKKCVTLVFLAIYP